MIETIVTVVSTLGGYEFIKWLYRIITNRENEQRINDAEADLKEFNALREQVEALELHNKEKEERFEAQIKKVREMQEEYFKLREELHKQRSENEDLRRQLTEINAKYEDIKSKYEQLTKEYSLITAKQDDSIKELQSRRTYRKRNSATAKVE